MKSKTTRKRIRTYISHESKVEDQRLLLPIVQRIVRAHLARQNHYSANDSIVHLNSHIKLIEAHFIDYKLAVHFTPDPNTKLDIIYTYNESTYLRSLVIKRDESLYKYFAREAL